MTEFEELRRRYIGGSDAPVIMRGEPGEMELLRQEKLGRYVRPPVLKPWALAVRRAMEPVICDWYETETGRKLSRRQEHLVSAAHPFMACHLDGLDEALPAVIDAKQIDEHVREPYEWAREHYAWQIMHQMVVADVTLGALYVAHGTAQPKQVVIEYDPFLASDLIERERWFWGFVERDETIPGAPAAEAPKAILGALAKPMRKVDMTGNNEWADLAGRWLENRLAAVKWDTAIRGLKALMETDVAEARGHGILVRRDGRGVTIKAEET